MARIFWRPRLNKYSDKSKKVVFDQIQGIGYSYGAPVALVYTECVILMSDLFLNSSQTRNCRYLEYFFTLDHEVNENKFKEHKIYFIPCHLTSHDDLNEYIKQTKEKVEELNKSIKRRRAQWSINAGKSQVIKYTQALNAMESLLFNQELSKVL